MLIKNGPHCLARAADVPCRGVGPWEAGAPAVAAPWQQSRRRQAWEMLAMVTALAKVVVVTAPAPAKGPGGSGRGGCTLRCSGTPSCCRPASCSTLRQSRHRRYQLHAIFRCYGRQQQQQQNIAYSIGAWIYACFFLLSFFLMRALLCIFYVLFHTLSLVRYLEEICHIPANSLSHPY